MTPLTSFSFSDVDVVVIHDVSFKKTCLLGFAEEFFKGIFWLNSSTFCFFFVQYEGIFPQPYFISYKTNVCEWSSNYMFFIHFDKVIKIWAGLGISLHISKAKNSCMIFNFYMLSFSRTCRSITLGLLYWEIYLTWKWISNEERKVYGGGSYKLDFICERKRGLVKYKARDNKENILITQLRATFIVR